MTSKTLYYVPNILPDGIDGVYNPRPPTMEEMEQFSLPIGTVIELTNLIVEFEELADGRTMSKERIPVGLIAGSTYWIQRFTVGVSDDIRMRFKWYKEPTEEERLKEEISHLKRRYGVPHDNIDEFVDAEGRALCPCSCKYPCDNPPHSGTGCVFGAGHIFAKYRSDSCKHDVELIYKYLIHGRYIS